MRRVAWEPHRSLRAFRSWDVKTEFGGGIVTNGDAGFDDGIGLIEHAAQRGNDRKSSEGQSRS